ncbi:enoyl-CoA hydratase-related protein [Flavisphingomonas formosensis]|uniref:enoyl-CoA hydratase-related protein n=1 Tax=Flavisphingomonas formosensis TaxID=861534 RepID=UPI0018DF038C|nr:enoyl-CoA hydratase-related protein [Sphingomonas formosensis]
MTDFIEVRREGRMTVFTIARPEAMNALNAPAHFEMAAKLDTFATDPDQWLAIVTGAGERAFCAGNDLKQQLAPREPVVPPTGFGGLTNRFDLDKPVIAAVNGMALGGGFELALACDIVVAAENASFALPEVKVGLAAMAGGLLRLPAHVGPKRAMEMIMTARRISAQEALDLGIVNRVVPAGEALAAALALAETILTASPLAIRASKAVMRRALEGDIREAMTAHLDWPEIVAMMGSDDAREGPRAFAEKRAPAWSGR